MLRGVPIPVFVTEELRQSARDNTACYCTVYHIMQSLLWLFPETGLTCFGDG